MEFPSSSLAPHSRSSSEGSPITLPVVSETQRSADDLPIDDSAGSSSLLERLAENRNTTNSSLPNIQGNFHDIIVEETTTTGNNSVRTRTTPTLPLQGDSSTHSVADITFRSEVPAFALETLTNNSVETPPQNQQATNQTPPLERLRQALVDHPQATRFIINQTGEILPREDRNVSAITTPEQGRGTMENLRNMLFGERPSHPRLTSLLKDQVPGGTLRIGEDPLTRGRLERIINLVEPFTPPLPTANTPHIASFLISPQDTSEENTNHHLSQKILTNTKIYENRYLLQVGKRINHLTRLNTISIQLRRLRDLAEMVRSDEAGQEMTPLELFDQITTALENRNKAADVCSTILQEVIEQNLSFLPPNLLSSLNQATALQDAINTTDPNIRKIHLNRANAFQNQATALQDAINTTDLNIREIYLNRATYFQNQATALQDAIDTTDPNIRKIHLNRATAFQNQATALIEYIYTTYSNIRKNHLNRATAFQNQATALQDAINETDLNIREIHLNRATAYGNQATALRNEAFETDPTIRNTYSNQATAYGNQATVLRNAIGATDPNIRNTYSNQATAYGNQATSYKKQANTQEKLIKYKKEEKRTSKKPDKLIKKAYERKMKVHNMQSLAYGQKAQLNEEENHTQEEILDPQLEALGQLEILLESTIKNQEEINDITLSIKQTESTLHSTSYRDRNKQNTAQKNEGNLNEKKEKKEKEVANAIAQMDAYLDQVEAFNHALEASNETERSLYLQQAEAFHNAAIASNQEERSLYLQQAEAFHNAAIASNQEERSSYLQQAAKLENDAKSARDNTEGKG